MLKGQWYVKRKRKEKKRVKERSGETENGKEVVVRVEMEKRGMRTEEEREESKR